MENGPSKKYWTSLEDLRDEGLEPEPESDARSILARLRSVDRRAFLRLMGSSLALGALSGCRKPVEKIVPYLQQPPEMTPGVPSWYATTCHGCSAACGAIAKVLDGRPIKFEGNPDHPMSRGGLCAVGQAAVLSLYDADRQRRPSAAGESSTWPDADAQIGQLLSQARERGGRVVVLTGTISGPATRAAITDFLAAFPDGRHVTYDAVSFDAIPAAHELAYGRPLIPAYRFDRADVIVSFGADFLGTWLSPVEFAKQYSAGRSPDAHPPRMSQHLQFESRLSLTGSNADHRYTLAPSQQPVYAVALLARIVAGLRTIPSMSAGSIEALQEAASSALPAGAEQALANAARALLNSRGRGLVVSESDDVRVQVAVLLLNDVLGNVGQTVDLSRPSQQRMGRDAEMAELIEAMQRGEVDVLIIHGCNPAYTYPEADEFEAGMRKVPCSVSFAWVPNETAALAKWHCPAHHPMEAWGDAEPQAGRLSLFQPTIRPLYDTRAFEDCLLKWSGSPLSFHEYLRRHWRKSIFSRQSEFSDFEAFWDAVLQRGFVEVPPPGQQPPALRWTQAAAAVAQLRPAIRPAGEMLEVEAFESVALRDGAPAGNPWLQELPDPNSKIAWDNYAAVGPSLARERAIAEGRLMEVRVAGRTVKAPAHIQPGQHPRTISIALGYGRTRAGIGGGVGVDAYPLVALREGRRHRSDQIESLRLLDERVAFARTQIHASMEGRRIVEETDFSRYRQGSAPTERDDHEDVSLWKEHEYPKYRWGMVIDLTKCIGCAACVTACDLENNVPVVGRDEVRRHREMHWIRIDRYFIGDPDAPRVVHQPMPCQHCANASCETVCPVLATVHDDQGLSVQVYNRCVGTRYCENNCPYKVRRFNFFNNVSNDLTRNLALNPDVTVRSRGVMEKCSFCIQRLQRAKIVARREGREVEDGEVQTACQQSCPADAIVFGNLADPSSRVSRLAASARAYRVLEELNRRPSVYYLCKVRNADEGAVG